MRQLGGRLPGRVRLHGCAVSALPRARSFPFATLLLVAAGCSEGSAGADGAEVTGGAGAAGGAGTEADASGQGGGGGEAGQGEPNAGATSRTDRLFDDHAPIWHFDIEVAASDWAWLNANQTLEQYVPAAVVFEGERFENAAIRYKGGYGTLGACIDDDGNLTCRKLSLKISFNEYDSAGRFHGVRKLILHGCARDPTCLRERLSYRLFRDAGVPTCRVVHATASVNKQDQGLFALVEYIDKEFLEDNFEDPEGNLYKERWPTSLDPGYYLEGLRTNEADADASRMTAFAGVVASTDDASFAADVAPFIDLEAMDRYNAVDRVINDWDGIWKFYCVQDACFNHNFYIYDHPASGRLVVIPWDLDFTFTKPDPDMGRSFRDDGPQACEIEEITMKELDDLRGTLAPQCDPLMRGLLRHDESAFRDALREILEGPETSRDALLSRLNRYRASIREAVAADPAQLPIEKWDEQVARLRQIIIEQYREAERLLAE
jgi:spore coat protein H